MKDDDQENDDKSGYLGYPPNGDDPPQPQVQAQPLQQPQTPKPQPPKQPQQDRARRSTTSSSSSGGKEVADSSAFKDILKKTLRVGEVLSNRPKIITHKIKDQSKLNFGDAVKISECSTTKKCIVEKATTATDYVYGFVVREGMSNDDKPYSDYAPILVHGKMVIKPDTTLFSGISAGCCIATGKSGSKCCCIYFLNKVTAMEQKSDKLEESADCYEVYIS